MRSAASLSLLGALLACGESPSPPDLCAIVQLPLAGAPNAPTVTDVGLEVQADGIVLVATASDPQGSGNVQGVQQTIRVFVNDRCQGNPIVMQDDLVDVDVEETFGTVVTTSSNPTLFNAIVGANAWPVEIDFADIDGNKTIGQVNARIEK